MTLSTVGLVISWVEGDAFRWGPVAVIGLGVVLLIVAHGWIDE